MVFFNFARKRNVRVTNLFHSLSSLPYQQPLQSSSPSFLSLYRLLSSRINRNLSGIRNMSNANSSIFSGKRDHYNGIIIDCESIAQDKKSFDERLKESLAKWKEEKVRGIWFNVSKKYADWIPVLVKNDFNFHHASVDSSTVTLCRWLPENEEPNIPVYSHTMVGIGAIVINENDEILTVRETYGTRIQWKLPGGYVEPDEHLADAAVREVREETNIETKFVSIVSFRHMHQAKFGCSDFYFIAHLTPLSSSIKKCDREIADCSWMKVKEYLDHPEVHINNKFFVQKYLENSQNKVAMIGNKTLHPVSKKEQYIFAIESTK